MAAKKGEMGVNIQIPAIKINYANLRIVGDSPLISHAWDEKAKRMILDKQLKKATAGKDIRRPAVEFANSLYWLTEKPDFDAMTDEDAQKAFNEKIATSKFGFPATAFKAAAIDGGFQQGVLATRAGTGDLAKTTVRGAMHIIGEYVEIEGVPVPREDMVRVGQGGADLRFRAEFKTWSATLNIRYNVNAVSLEQIINLFNIGGFAVGVGDWRPAKDGTFGTFHVEFKE